MKKLAVIILAAGEGKRMESNIPKVLHPLCGKPMISYVVETARSLRPTRIVVVVGVKSGEIKEALKPAEDVPLQFAIQDPPKGTGDAVMCAEQSIEEHEGSVLVLCGDVPLLEQDTIRRLVEFHDRKRGAATVLTATFPDPSSYGRIVRKGDKVLKIVEHGDASDAEREIDEINTGIYVFEKSLLFEALRKVKPSNAQREYYLTDTVQVLCKEGKEVYGFSAPDWRQVTGINTRKTLAEIEQTLQARIVQRDQPGGVTVTSPVTTQQ
jgi:bifunctional UDP-N-acetylglucosamine pyrophosphorylase/glucosamine-1-phosphate N-acetyltransferase